MIFYHSKGEADILKELVSIANKHPEAKLIQFQSLVSAYQYRLLYYLFRKYVQKGTKVLDWGVGNGHFSYFLTRAGYNAFGYSLGDFPIVMDLADTSYYFVQGRPEDPKRLPFKDRSFAAIASVGVLEHVNETGGNDVVSMREITRILEPGGVFICYHIPNRFSLIEALARRFPHKYHHSSRYSISSIVNLMGKAKLQMVEIKRYGFLPRNVWCHVPVCLGNRIAISKFWDILDMFLAYPFTIVCQNYLFVARKPIESNSKTI
jgi:SAM-dependent methyltransferase